MQFGDEKPFHRRDAEIAEKGFFKVPWRLAQNCTAGRTGQASQLKRFSLRSRRLGGGTSLFREIIESEEMHLSCAICEIRKEKRFCPAVHGKICPQCCGEQREVTLDCPSECPYLQQSREHATIHHSEEPNERPGQWDRDAVFPKVEIPEVEINEQFLYEHEELILGLSFALVKRARADRSIMDRDLMAALCALAKKYQTLVNSSIIYEQPMANVAHQEMAREVETMIREFREAEQQHLGEIPGHTRLRDSDVLKAMVFLLRMGLGRTSGRPKSRAFVDFLLAQFPERNSAIAGPAEGGSRIVIP
jgi:hypothetical protein